MNKNITISSYFVTVKNKENWGQTINAPSAGRAKSEYYRNLLDSWPDIPYTSIRVKKINNKPFTSEQFKSNAKYRGFSNLKCGQKVEVNNNIGYIVGHNASANFNVYFENDNPRYKDITLSVHPNELVILEN